MTTSRLAARAIRRSPPAITIRRSAATAISAIMKRNLSFSDITFLREASGLPVLVKGVVQPDDIKQSLADGAAGIWVSNHGGRQMDGGPASISMLRAAVDTVAGRVPVVLDSGIRRGIDIFKALSLGATAVGIGRPALWGLINGGSQGVKGVYAQLAFELKSTMLLSGVAKVIGSQPQQSRQGVRSSSTRDRHLRPRPARSS